MIDENLLNSLSAKEKELFKQGLEDLINQTYVIEDEYKKLGESYNALKTPYPKLSKSNPMPYGFLIEMVHFFYKTAKQKISMQF